jgi:nucleoside-diphosphate-sugar epimerase
MRVLVMGGTGLLGSGIVRRLVEHGHSVFVISRGAKPVNIPSTAQFGVADRNDRDALVEIVQRFRPDAVVDCVAYTGEHGITDIEVFRGRVAQIVMVSTDFVYSPTYQRLPIGEDAPLRAGTPYSEGKVDCEEVLLGATGLPVTIIRPPHIMGPGGRLGSGSIQGRDASLIERIREGIPVALIDAGTYLLQPLHVDDAGDAISAIIGNANTLGKRYNLAGASFAPTSDYYKAVADLLGVSLRSVSVPGDVWLAIRPDQVSFVRHRVYDLSRLLRDTGWSPTVTMEESVRRTVRDILDRGANARFQMTAAEEKLLNLLDKSADDMRNALSELAV